MHLKTLIIEPNDLDQKDVEMIFEIESYQKEQKLFHNKLINNFRSI